MPGKFKIGDVVKLKSDGPDMTVKAVPEQLRRFYTCQWFAGKKLEDGQFEEASLEAAPKKKTP